MTTREQKNLEKKNLERCLQDLSIRFTNLSDGEDPPDFDLKTKKGKIWVEITEYHESSQRTALEKRYESLEKFLREKRYLNALDGYGANFTFEKENLPLKKDFSAFANELHVLFTNHPLQIGEKVLIHHAQLKTPILSKALREVQLSRENLKGFFCYSNFHVKIGGASAIEIITCAQKKTRLGPLPKNYSEAWLFIAGGVLPMSTQMGFLDMELLHGSYQNSKTLECCGYDKIFVCNFSENFVWTFEKGFLQASSGHL